MPIGYRRLRLTPVDSRSAIPGAAIFIDPGEVCF
jgi:hypothetical protein